MFLLVLTISPLAQKQSPSADFLSFLKTLDAAQVELQNGKPEAFKSLWSQSDDVT
jgi:hypothetical protein